MEEDSILVCVLMTVLCGYEKVVSLDMKELCPYAMRRHSPQVGEDWILVHITRLVLCGCEMVTALHLRENQVLKAWEGRDSWMKDWATFMKECYNYLLYNNNGWNIPSFIGRNLRKFMAISICFNYGWVSVCVQRLNPRVCKRAGFLCVWREGFCWVDSRDKWPMWVCWK